MIINRAEIELLVRAMVAELAAKSLAAPTAHETCGCHPPAKTEACGCHAPPPVATPLPVVKKSETESCGCHDHDHKAPVSGLLNLRVISVKDLPSGWRSQKELAVQTGAILTPSAKDELRAAGVKVVFRTAASDHHHPKQPLIWTTARLQMDAGHLQKSVERTAGKLNTLTANSVPDLRTQLAQELGSAGQQAVVITDEAALLLCALHRHVNLRCIAPSNLAELRRGLPVLHPNVLVIEPRGKSTFELQRIIAEFTQYETPCNACANDADLN